MHSPRINRRNFVRISAIGAALPLLLNCKGDILAQLTDSPDILAEIKRNAITTPGVNWCGAKDAPHDVSWKTILATAGDEGEPIKILGTVYGADGKTLAPNTLIYLYHADAVGIYGREGEHRHGRYRGWMLTDAFGRYQFRSIRPASYPGTTFAAHIHMTVTTKNLREDSIDSILFEGDPFITPQERIVRKGGFDPIIRLEKASDGLWTGTRDIKLV